MSNRFDALAPLTHEAFIAGALLVDPERTLREVRGLLTPHSFSSPTYSAMYAAALELEAESEALDAASICHRTNRMGHDLSFETCRELMRIVPTLEALASYAEKVAEAEDARNLKAALYEGYVRLENGDDMASVRGDMEAGLSAIRERGASALISSQEAMERTFQAMQTGKSSFIGSGYGKLNRVLGGGDRGGFIKSGLHIIAARPGTGKTTFALQIAENVAKKGIKTLFISLEMSVEQLSLRRLAFETGLSLNALQNMDESESENWRKVARASAELSKRPLYMNLHSQLNVNRIERHARSIGAEFLVIDYLGIIQHKGGSSLYEKVTATSNALKRMAVSLDIPILCLCQLNRVSAGKRPQLSELRDSGAIEQDADTVILQWLPDGRPEDEYQNSSSPVYLECIVAKNRHGAQGKVTLSWYMQNGRIRE